MPINRRRFLQVSAASGMIAAFGLQSEAQTTKIVDSGQSLKFTGANYTWEWSAEHDRFRVLDQLGRIITSGPMQPLVMVQQRGKTAGRQAISGKLEGHQVQGNRVVWIYANPAGKLTATWRFDDNGFWIEPAVYESSATQDIISFNLFAESAGEAAQPALDTDYLVLPGISESDAISPISKSSINWDMRTSLGRTGTGLSQQWGLPSHYFAGFRNTSGGHAVEPARPDITRAFCCGLSDLPNADLYIEQKNSRASLVFDYRGDLWGHMRGPGKFTLGAGLYWAFAPNYHEAIRNYYRGLLNAGIIRKKVNSTQKNATLLTPQWCIWGEQVALKKVGSQLTQADLEQFYGDLKTSGLHAGMLSIDDGWEGRYGSLEHSTERFPRFEQFLDRVRADGLRIGIWAAFMRCQDPADLGLTPAQMLQRVDGKPHVIGEGSDTYYILDFTRPEVERAVRERARRYIRRYKPDLVKFDFGYEIPALDAVAPHDMRWAGERMLAKGLDVVVGSMRQENPDVVVMYYQLSPLFADYLDLHSPDDLFMAKGAYDLETNRRLFFSSLCGEFGMPTYGSSGYDWASESETWFDSVAMGTIGSLGTLRGPDDAGGKPTSKMFAKYNGLTHLVRPTNQFTVQPLDPIYESGTRGAHASSWVRLEDGQAVLVALRMQRLDGGPGRHEFRDVLSTTASVVVASKTADALERSTKLAVVPYGEGRLTLRRASPAAVSAEVTEHYFGGQSATNHVEISAGKLVIPLRETGDDGSLLEWIGVDILGT